MRIGNSVQTNYLNNNFRQTGLGNSQDAQLKSIQDQIARVQKAMQKLTENKGMSSEQIMAERKELQQQLQDLNKQAMQRQIEIQKEQREQNTKKQESTKNSQTSDSESMGIATVQGIISAGTALAQVKAIGMVKTEMEGQAGVLGTEIELDKGRGRSTEYKEAKLADLQDKISSTASQMTKQFSNISKTLEDSAKSTDNTVDDKESNKGADSGKKVSNSETNLDKKENSSNKELTAEANQNKSNQKVNYIHIDLKL